MAKRKPKHEPKRDVPQYRRCPLCYGDPDASAHDEKAGMGGVGTAYATRRSTRYYKCDRCGHTWTAQITAETVKIENRQVELSTRQQASPPKTEPSEQTAAQAEGATPPKPSAGDSTPPNQVARSGDDD